MINGVAQFGYRAWSGREEKPEWHGVARDAWEILAKKFSRGRWPGEDCDFDNPSVFWESTQFENREKRESGEILDYLHKARRNMSLTVIHGLTGKRSSDQYIVAYPRSGSTWLRTMLATLIEPENGFEPDIFNALIPSVGLRYLRAIRSLPDPRLMMSHTTYRPGLRRVVYVVRDGRDAVVSLYHHGTTRAGREILFPEWFDLYCGRQFGPCWHENVEGWLTKGRQHLGDNMLVVKFEELKRTPVPQIQAIAGFLGIRADEQSIGRAIEMAGLEKAREREKRATGKLEDPNASFYRGGKTGQWQEYLNGAIYQKFLDLSGAALKLAGYAP